MKVYWFSRHALSPAQQQAIRDLHGEDAEIVHDTGPFADLNDCIWRIRRAAAAAGTAVYAVLPAHFAVALATADVRFGMFENHPSKRANGQFGLKSVWRTLFNDSLERTEVVEVWTNPDPQADCGELLAVPTWYC